MARLKKSTLRKSLPLLCRNLTYKNSMQIPKLEKIVIGVGCGDLRTTPRRWTPLYVT